MPDQFDVVVIGAGASGLMCAARAGERKKRVAVLDSGPRPGRKILMAGGGKCNFTNRSVTAENFICTNPHFVKSALSRFTPEDFIAMVEASDIPYHERSHGQLFCNDSSTRILDMLLTRCRSAGVRIVTGTAVSSVSKPSKDFRLEAGNSRFESPSLVVATGGVSVPQAGASPFGYKVAEQFGIDVVPPRPGLVPFTLSPEDKAVFQSLSGISVTARVSCQKTVFEEQLLFTHRGLSGPVILQASSYWQPGETVTVDLLPHMNLGALLEETQRTRPKRRVRPLVGSILPKRLVDTRLKEITGLDRPLAALSRETLQKTAQAFHGWQVKPGGTEGYRTAEVTVGGVDCNAVSSKTFEAKSVPGLYFIGEVLDVAGQLGGFNLQWAWSSGYCAGTSV